MHRLSILTPTAAPLAATWEPRLSRLARLTKRSLLRLSLTLLLVVLIAALLAGGSSHTLVAADESSSPPNIVLIMADDLGWTDLGCMGSEYYETPFIDQLAAEGLTLTSFNVCQNCAPTRAALMSGQYGVRTGVYTVGSPERGKAKNRQLVPPPNLRKLPLDRVTLAERLQEAGYQTAMFGKWHLGTDAEHHPAARGFDQAIVSNGRHFKIRTNPEQSVPADKYLADYLTDEAVRFIRQEHEAPFFLYVPHFAVHTPIRAKKELIAKYREKAPVGGHNNPTYAAMIQSVDESVGRIREALAETGAAENTLVIFMSDNGGLGGYRVPGTDRTKGITDNAPLRGGKGTLYEGGVRVPFIVAWPKRIPAGARSDQPAIHVDLYPTLLSVAKQAPPQKAVLDGVNLLPHWLAPEASFDRGPLYHHFPGYLQAYIPEATWRTTPVSTIRVGGYKLIEFFEEGRLELYNLREDLSETKNLVDQEPEKAAALHRQLQQWRESVQAPLPTPKPQQSPSDN